MASITHHQDKKTGAVYRYSVESYWDKEKKAPRNKQIYLGKVDPDTGELIPARRKKKKTEKSKEPKTVTARVVGSYLLLEQLSSKLSLTSLIKKCFGEDALIIMSLVYFLVEKGLPLSRVETWSQATLHPVEDFISSQSVSELLHNISEDDRQHFFALWMNKILEKDYLCYDITSISSYARNNIYLHWGYNRDGESLEQINLAMLFGQKTRLPVYYRRLPGNISDVSTLKTTIKSLDFLGASTLHLVLDRGFYSKANIDELYRKKYKFTIAVPVGRKWVEKIMDEHYESISSPQNYLSINDNEALYTATSLYKWGLNNHRLYVHVYYSAEQAAAHYDAFTRKLIALKQELKAENYIEKHAKLYERFFTIKETPKRGRKIEFNDDEIQKYRKRYAGFFCIVSNQLKQAKETLNVYRAKDVVENCFDDLKNHLDMKRLRVHSSEAMDTRLFLQFLALIYVSEIRQISKGNDALKYLTVRDIMEQLGTLTQVKYAGRYGKLFTETTPLQREIFSAFDISLVT